MSVKQVSCKENDLIFGTGLSSAKTYEELYELIKHAISVGIVAFDTAPSYCVEHLVGNILDSLIKDKYVLREDIFIQNKIDAWQMQEGNGNVQKYIFDSLKKMSLQYFDCVLIHWPIPEYRDETVHCLFNLKKAGIIRYVGICNIRLRQLLELEKADLIPDIVQIERNPLRTCYEEAEFCKNRRVVLQSYSPLCKFCDDIKSSSILSNLSEEYGKSIGQIVMRWHIDSGFVPVFTTKKTNRIEEYANIRDFSLLPDDIKKIDSMNKKFKMYLESVACPGF